mgnify:CR=1 FL=1
MEQGRSGTIGVVVVAAGAVLSVQAAINGRLGQTVGVLRASLVTFVVGAITLGSGRTNLMQGAIHLVVFAAFLFLTFVP